MRFWGLASVVWAVLLTAGAERVRAASFSVVATEQSWHRRARRQRQAARGILAVERARDALARHHGGGMATRDGNRNGNRDVLRGPKSPSWGCNCGELGNWASRVRCRGCGVDAPARIRTAAQKAEQAAKITPNGSIQPPPRGAWAMGAPGNGRVLQLEARNKSLQAENKKLREASKGADAEAKEPARAGDSMEVDGDGVLDAAVSRARVYLKQLKDLPEAVRGLLAGGYEARLATAQAELEQANVARRAANPLKKQMDGAENHKARMAKKLEDAKSALQEREAAREAINAQIVERVAAVAEAEAANAKASAEVAAVAAKYASERTDPTRIVLDGEDAPPGFVSIQFADGKWAEREAVFAQQIAQLTALVAAQGEGSAAASEGSPSVADEDEDLEGDEAWSQVTRDKRRKVLRKERDVLASKVRSSLGKVSSHASPFNESRRIRK